MKPETPAPLELSLEPIDSPRGSPAIGTSADRPPVIEDALSTESASERDPAEPPSDGTYLAQAMREYEQGQIDTFLWTRAMAKAAGDQTLARTYYLESRVVAVRVLKRDRRSRRPQRSRTSGANDNGRLAAFDDPAAAHGHPRRWAFATAKVRLAVAAGVVVAVVAGGLVFVATNMGETARPAAVAATARPSPGSAPGAAKPGAAAAGVTPKALTSTTPSEDAEKRLIARVRELREAGNWNVLVLTANEWTRSFPGNPVAWQELSAGFVKLRQYDDALDAARRAQQLSPDNPALWRQLGQIQLQRNDVVGALAAFRQVALQDPQDASNFTQVGLLHAQLDQLPEAHAAFDQALAISPEDPLALCGAASVAQREGRRKDADALARQVAGLGVQCPISNRHPGTSNAASQPTEAMAVRPPRR